MQQNPLLLPAKHAVCENVLRPVSVDQRMQQTPLLLPAKHAVCEIVLRPVSIDQRTAAKQPANSRLAAGRERDCTLTPHLPGSTNWRASARSRASSGRARATALRYCASTAAGPSCTWRQRSTGRLGSLQVTRSH